MKKVNCKYLAILIVTVLVSSSLVACKIELPEEVQLNASSEDVAVLTEGDKLIEENTDVTNEELGKAEEEEQTSISVDDIQDEEEKDYSKYEDNTETTTYVASTWNHDKDSGNFEFKDDDGDGRDDESGLDQYLTDPIPSGKPKPVEPEDAIVTGSKQYCTLSIRMDTILDNINNLDEELKYMLDEEPIKSGVIYHTKKVEFNEGESVFDVLLRETKVNGIHMEFSFTPMYNSSYIEGINNFYEFSCGELSGWMYCVNGWYPNYGCSRYEVKSGDVIEWNYTCDLGRDLPGGEWLGELK